MNFGWGSEAEGAKRREGSGGREAEAAMFNFECWMMDDEWKREGEEMMNDECKMKNEE